VRNAKAIKVMVENWNDVMHTTQQSLTRVTIDAIVDKGRIMRTGLRFNEDGTFRGGSPTSQLTERERIDQDSARTLPSADDQIPDLRSK
jgi:hypothetical protein